MKEIFDYVILGGGVAGLTAARRLLELGIKPLVIESGGYPTHKVCGEFISPSSLPLLNRWDIHPLQIHETAIHTHAQSFTMKLSSPAGSLSHLTLDTQMAKQIEHLGATLMLHTKVEALTPSNDDKPHRLVLSPHGEIFAKHLLIATGRLANPVTPHFKYAGFKTHFSGITLPPRLELFSFPGAYLGVSPVENGVTNVACLTPISGSADDVMTALIASHPYLKQLLSTGTNMFSGWMKASVPEFGLRSPPNWPRTYWIGDAAGTIPPASGNGLTLAIASGCLAAEYASRNDPEGYRRAWKTRCKSPIFLAKGLHKLFLTPSLGNSLLQASHWFPALPQMIFNLTRG